MQPSPETQPSAATPLVEVFDDLVPPTLHAAAWTVCQGSGWYFGHGSNAADWSRFWKMDLDGVSAYDAIWEHARPRMEALVGAPLRVIRQYANGHTYGLGGNPHRDDARPGTYTLLYYPNPEWKDGWEGETVYYDQNGEIALSVRLRPNRAVFFDSRILHNGRAPSRTCPVLRVTVAYKVEIDPAGSMAGPAVSKPAVQPELPSHTEHGDASRIYRIPVSAAEVEAAVTEHLSTLAKSVRIPGFLPGNIPLDVINQRYGEQAERNVLNRIRDEAIRKMIPSDGVIASVELRPIEGSRDAEIEVRATLLSALANPDVSKLELERWVSPDVVIDQVGRAEATEALRIHLRRQVLDYLDASYQFAVGSPAIDRELAAVRKAMEASATLPRDDASRKKLIEELRAVAERRVRLGLVVAELGRRLGVRAQGAALDDAVLDHLIQQARITEREVSEDELRTLLKD